MVENLLNDDLLNQIRELYKAQLIHPILLLFFYCLKDCNTCEETNRLLEEISQLSDQIEFKQYNIDEDPAIAKKYHIQLTPGLVVAGNDHGEIIDYGIRFAGIPSGYEFGSLIQAMIMVSKRDSGLKPEMRAQVKDLKKPVHLQVFVTPTWPYCPQAVVLAHQMALENPHITSEMIEANEFYDLALRYNVSGVPQTMINDGAGVVLGAVPPEYLLQEIRRTI